MIANPLQRRGYKKFLDIDDLFGEVGYHTLGRNSCRPSFDVCIWATIRAKARRPSFLKAYAKVSCRLVANQDHHKVSQAFIDYIESIARSTSASRSRLCTAAKPTSAPSTCPPIRQPKRLS